MLLPDTVGHRGDSTNPLPARISFPAGSGLVAFAAAIGRHAAWTCRNRVGARFTGSLQARVTLPRWGNAIPYVADPEGAAHRGQSRQGQRPFLPAGFMEIRGLPDLKAARGV